MIKNLIKHFTIWIKEEVKESDLKDKPLQYLIIAKEYEHDYYGSKLPLFFAWLWIIISVYITVQSKYNSCEVTDPIFAKVFPWVTLLFIIRLIKSFSDLKKNSNITNNNLKIYDKIIEEKIKKEEKVKKEYETKILEYLKWINEKLW